MEFDGYGSNFCAQLSLPDRYFAVKSTRAHDHEYFENEVDMPKLLGRRPSSLNQRLGNIQLERNLAAMGGLRSLAFLENSRWPA
jgi:hypothetical protein